MKGWHVYTVSAPDWLFDQSVNIRDFKIPVQIIPGSYANWPISHFIGEEKTGVLACGKSVFKVLGN